jgi:hypothetical protein
VWSWRSATAVEVLVVLFDLELEGHEVGQGVGETGRAQLVANLAALPFGDDEAAAPQARQVVRDVRTARPERVGQVGRVGRPIEEDEEDAPPGRVGQRRADPLKSVGGRGDGGGGRDDVTIQPVMDSG